MDVLFACLDEPEKNADTNSESLGGCVPRSRRLILVLFLLSSQFAFLVILFDGNVSDSNAL